MLAVVYVPIERCGLDAKSLGDLAGGYAGKTMAIQQFEGGFNNLSLIKSAHG